MAGVVRDDSEALDGVAQLLAGARCKDSYDALMVMIQHAVDAALKKVDGALARQATKPAMSIKHKNMVRDALQIKGFMKTQHVKILELERNVRFLHTEVRAINLSLKQRSNRADTPPLNVYLRQMSDFKQLFDSMQSEQNKMLSMVRELRILNGVEGTPTPPNPQPPYF